MTERFDPKMGPLNFAQFYSDGLQQWAKQSEPVLKSVARCNLEVMGLATRRARAWVELPSQLRSCKSPQELAREQLNFWQSAALDYAQGTQRLALAFASIASAAWTPPRDGKSVLQRDYIAFAESGSAQEDATRERKAA